MLAQASFGVAYSIFLILPKYLATQLAATTGRIGWIMAGAAVSNVVAAPFVGRIRDSGGARRAMVAGNLALAAGAVGFVFVKSPGLAAFLCRGLHGLGWALVFAAAGLLAIAIAPRERMAEALALHGSANLVTNAIGPALAEPALLRLGPTPVFTAAAAMAVLSAVLSMRVPAPPSPPPAPRGHSTTRTPLLVIGTSLMLGVACWTMFTLHQPLALARGIDRVAGFLVAYTVAAVSVRLALPRLTDRVGPDRVAVASFVFYGLVVAATPAVGRLPLWPFGGAFGLAHGVFYPAFLAFSLGNAPEGSRAPVMAWFNGTFNGGALLVIPLGMLAESHGFAAAFLPVGIATVLVALVLGQRTRVLASRRPPR
jgi:MFS family permease